MGPGYYFYLEGLVGFDGGGSWVVHYFIRARSLFIAKCRGVGAIMNAIDFPLSLRNCFWQALSVSFCCKH